MDLTLQDSLQRLTAKFTKNMNYTFIREIEIEKIDLRRRSNERHIETSNKKGIPTVRRGSTVHKHK